MLQMSLLGLGTPLSHLFLPSEWFYNSICVLPKDASLMRFDSCSYLESTWPGHGKGSPPGSFIHPFIHPLIYLFEEITPLSLVRNLRLWNKVFHHFPITSQSSPNILHPLVCLSTYLSIYLFLNIALRESGVWDDVFFHYIEF